MIEQPFCPAYGRTVAAATINGAVNVTVPTDSRQILLVNVGTQLVFVRVKPQGVTADATAADMPLAAGASRVITKDPQSQGVVSIAATAVGSTVYVCPGDGYGNT